MKNKQITLTLILAFFLGSITNVHSQRNGKSSSVSTVSGLDIESEADKRLQDKLNQKLANRDVTIVQNTLPKNSLGVSAGYGATNDFERQVICGGIDYQRRIAISESERTGYYGGIDLMYENIDFNNFKSNHFYGGGKIQVNTAIVPSGETQLTAGIMGQYGFGDTDNGTFSDSFSGFRGCVYAGLDVHKSEKWSLGFVLPLFVHESLTYKPDIGEDVNVDESSLFIGKSPARISIRHKF